MSTTVWVLRAKRRPDPFLPREFFMRKIITISTVAAAAFLVSACGGSQPAATENTAAVTEMNAADAMEGTTNDAMTNVDAATGADANMAADVNATAAAPAADNAAAPATNAADAAAK
jgi:hypothetical protein